MNINNRMTSIARKINFSFWFKRLWATLWMDILIILLIAGSFIWWRCNQVPQGRQVTNINIENETDFYDAEGKQEWILVVEDSAGERHPYLLRQFWDYVFIPVIAVLAIQVIDLITALFNTGNIRKKLKPLNDLAVTAEKLSALPLDTSKFESLEHAIESLSPDAPDARVSTGDKDLRSIEVALNNLLARMRESQKQQARFVSDASHELRTPIAVIQGYVNMLDRWGKEDESVLEESIEALKHESEHMKELVEQLLFLARGDSGKNTLHCKEFDLNEVVREVWEESLMIDDKHVYEFVNSQGSAVDEEGRLLNPPAIIWADMAMVKQSLRILVQNAAKYSVNGGVISFRVEQQENTVSYMVQDEGIGIGEEQLVHIFEPFYRSDEARNGQTGGSGLGLSIAKWIVDAHEGTIRVLSVPDMGTRFTVQFPQKSENGS